MKKFILPIAAIAALTAMAVAMSAISTPKKTLAPEPTIAQTGIQTQETVSPKGESCCDEPAPAVVAENKENCGDCVETMKTEDCTDCDKHEVKAEASTL